MTARANGSRFVATPFRAIGCLFLAGAALTSQAGTTSYTYDVHGRLKTVTSPSGADEVLTTLTFDNADNRTSFAIATTDLTPPYVPTGLSAVAQAFDRIQLNWTASSDVGGGAVTYRL